MRFSVCIIGILLCVLNIGLSFNNALERAPRSYAVSVNYWKKSSGSGFSNQPVNTADMNGKGPRSYAVSVNYWKKSTGLSHQTSITSVAAIDGTACSAESYVGSLTDSKGATASTKRSYGLSAKYWENSGNNKQQVTSTESSSPVGSKSESTTRSYGLSKKYWENSGNNKQQVTSTESSSPVDSKSESSKPRSYGLSKKYWENSGNNKQQVAATDNDATTGYVSSKSVESTQRSYGLSKNYWKQSGNNVSQQITSSPVDSTTVVTSSPKKGFLSDSNKELLFSLLNVAAIGYVAGILIEILVKVIKLKRALPVP